MVWTLLASEPACSSVRANAASFSPRASGGQPARLLLGRAEEDQGPQADRVMGVDEHGRRGAVAADHLHDPAIAHLREPAAAELDGRGHAQHAELGQALDHRGRDVGLAVDRGGVDVRVGERADRGHRLLDRRPLGLGQLGIGEERIAAELAPEQRLGEAGRRRARDQQLLRLADLPGAQGLVALRHRLMLGRRGCRGHGPSLLM